MSKPLENVVVFTRDNCGYCVRAKALLDKHRIDFIELPLDPTARSFLIGSGLSTVPQIYASGRLVGGFTALDLLLSTSTDPELPGLLHE